MQPVGPNEPANRREPSASSRFSNIVAFINPTSGERASADFLFAELRLVLGPRVVDLSQCFGNVDEALRIAQEAKDGVVIVCGGDGTVSWGMDIVDQVDWGRFGDAWQRRPYISCIPMGTANDLSRHLGFGPGFSKASCCCGCSSCCRLQNIESTLQKSLEAFAGTMDRWKIEVTSLDPANRRVIEQRKMNNYFSIGFDAQIALRFDHFRKRNPGICSLRIMNKCVYTMIGARALCGSPQLHNSLQVYVDGVEIDPSRFQGIKSLVVSNVASFASGVQLWKDSRKRFQPVSIDDGLVEVQGMYGSFHMGLMQVGLRNAVKIAQGKVVVIRASAVHFMEWDGEAMEKVREVCEVRISHAGKTKILHHTTNGQMNR
jgi:diacylglycerol kinase (ATP)